MTVQREFKVRNEHISVARETLIFDFFFIFIFFCEIVPKYFLKLTNLICLVLDDVSFYKNDFWWEG